MTPTRLTALAAILTLGACDTALDTYYRAGGTVSRLETDMLNCEVKALRDAPVANEVRQRAPVFVPCPGYRCFGGGYWADGGIYTVDVNKDLRNRVTDQCMAQKGYGRVSIPRCSSTVAAQVPAQRMTVMPTLNEGSCVVRNEDDTYQVVQTR